MFMESIMDMLYYNTNMTMEMYNLIAGYTIDFLSAYFVGSMLRKLIDKIRDR